MYRLKNKKINYRFILLCICVVISVIFIWTNSMASAKISLQQSENILYSVLPFVEKIDINIERLHFFIRKFAHMTEFAIFSVLFMLLLKYKIKKLSICIIMVVYSCTVVGLIDETLQLFSLGRTSHVVDVWIDTLGGIIGMILFIIFNNIFNNKKR